MTVLSRSLHFAALLWFLLFVNVPFLRVKSSLFFAALPFFVLEAFSPCLRLLKLLWIATKDYPTKAPQKLAFS